MIKKAESLADWVDHLQSVGQYTFTRSQALSALGGRRIALKRAVHRLIQKGRVVTAGRGFYVIVPLEYKSSGALPATWFIDSLMKSQRRPYYVGLLSAAEIHGAAHQRPQEFQVVSDIPLRPIRVGRGRIRFFRKIRLPSTPVTSIKTETGTMQVSTPEATALDLVRYAKRAGGLGNVATVLHELSERMNPKLLLAAAKKEPESSTVQRLGYLLEHFGAPSLAHPLARWLATRQMPFIPLRPEQNSRSNKKDVRWNLIINEKIEADL